jgi:F0F1-type ATP synthase membrane subunit c/vacuolar-type H+-ATPase subunit K
MVPRGGIDLYSLLVFGRIRSANGVHFVKFFLFVAIPALHYIFGLIALNFTT